MKLPVISPSELRNVREVYAEIPKIECKRLCQRYCGVVFGSAVENVRLSRRIGKSWVETVHKKISDAVDLECIALKNGACSVYDDRPLMCRLFGVTEKLRCPHGCVPERLLTEDEVCELVRRMHATEHGQSP